MGCIKVAGLVSLAMAIGFGYIWHKLDEFPDIPDLPDTYWGAGQPKPDDKSVVPFSVNIKESVSSKLNKVGMKKS